jgi:Flp pilus assembly protein TadD
MKSLSLLKALCMLALVVSLAAVPLLAQQEQRPATQDPTAQQPSMSQSSAQGQTSQIFVGKVSKSKGDLVLRDDAGTSYKLDNADQAKQFVGKSVKVTGTLDAATNTIHVTNIEGPSS